MSPLFRAGLFGLALCVSSPAFADLLFVHVPIGRQGTLTAPSFVQVDQSLRAIPGGADAVPADTYKNSYALSMKDMLQTTPGVFAQPRWGEESRLSIRGSGLSRGFHLRGITILQDGVPFNFADGSTDFQELDPLTLRHIEVYRGGNGLRYGAATLGGAINAVTQTAQDMDYNALLRLEGGSFHTKRLHAESGQVFGQGDVYASYTKSLSEGYRENSEGNNMRFNGNAGLQLNDRAETRFYISYNRLNQNIPGTISKNAAEHQPTRAALANIIDQYARDINSLRIANRTAFDLGQGRTLEVGGYMNNKDLYHPIFQVVDQQSLDLGLFARLKGDRYVLGINAGRGYN
ncbi:MAG TPA: TonB-dependent receptor, partial [Alphaproteobacteria bacterium]